MLLPITSSEVAENAKALSASTVPSSADFLARTPTSLGADE